MWNGSQIRCGRINMNDAKHQGCSNLVTIESQ